MERDILSLLSAKRGDSFLRWRGKLLQVARRWSWLCGEGGIRAVTRSKGQRRCARSGNGASQVSGIAQYDRGRLSKPGTDVRRTDCKRAGRSLNIQFQRKSCLAAY